MLDENQRLKIRCCLTKSSCFFCIIFSFTNMQCIILFNCLSFFLSCQWTRWSLWPLTVCIVPLGNPPWIQEWIVCRMHQNAHVWHCEECEGTSKHSPLDLHELRAHPKGRTDLYGKYNLSSENQWTKTRLIQAKLFLGLRTHIRQWYSIGLLHK